MIEIFGVNIEALMNYIELFAGCGGLSLGLKSSGFKLIMANELSPMASESYAFNFFNEDLHAQSLLEKPFVKNTLWLSSKYPTKDLKLRLREDPRVYPAIGDGYMDINPDGSNLKGNLVVGNIIHLNQWLRSNSVVTENLKNGFGDGEIDLISGGPPCQSFSMAGLRKQDCEKNNLPWEFVTFANIVKPKFILLENVTGILRPFHDNQGNHYYAWFEIAKAFALIGYIPLCLHINAKFAGVPQNRPRFVMIGIKEDCFYQLKGKFNTFELELFDKPLGFFNKMKSSGEANIADINYRDMEKPNDFSIIKASFLKPLTLCRENFLSVKDAIDDLRENVPVETDYTKIINSVFSQTITSRKMKNHVLRTNSDLVRRRFRLYQVLQQVDRGVSKEVLSILKEESADLSKNAWEKLSNFNYLTESGDFTTFNSKTNFIAFLQRHVTKKQTQKALIADQPAPAAMSIADDVCHYHHNEQRTLTVREMARIQSFPDNFEFRSKTTTGGQMRRFEVPQYTQVGNAVPPLLGRALGLVIRDLLHRLSM